MKIRINSNSIRLRLTKTEIATFAEVGVVSESINFGDSKLKYILKKGDTKTLIVSYHSNEIEVIVPDAQAKTWTNTDLVSLDEFITIAKNETLRILVEKDFKCLNPRVHEDETDHYPHPNEQEMVC
jgi:hypothetical protein